MRTSHRLYCICIDNARYYAHPTVSLMVTCKSSEEIKMLSTLSLEQNNQSIKTDSEMKEFGNILVAKRTISSFFRLVLVIAFALLIIFQIFSFFSFLFKHPQTHLSVSILPQSIDDLRNLATTLIYYANPNGYPLSVFFLYVSIYLWKQSFAIPGSALLNLLGGVLYGGWIGAILACILTSVGSTICYWLSWYGGSFIIASLPQQKISYMKLGISKHQHNLFFYLLSLRLFPFTPNWLVNFLSPWLNIPVSYFSISLFLGSFPYNFICTQAGSLLQSINDMSDILTRETLVKLILIAILALFPAFIRDRMQRKPS